MIGKIISHYRVIDKLGEGGMGVVYKAEDTKLDRRVALKFLTPQAIGSRQEKARFVLEAKAAAALSHSNICHVYEIDESEGQSFIAMEYVDGEDLKAKIESGPLKLDEAVNLAIQIAEGLRVAHEREIVHRDIKPANIMVTSEGQVKIMDFGLAKSHGRMQLTKTGTTLGTVAYMSPEQARGEEVDARTDIWSLGVLLYEMITGQKPFKGDYEPAVVYSILNAAQEPLTALRTGVSVELERIVNKALDKDYALRYQSAADLCADLKRLRRDSSTDLVAVSPPPVAVSRKRRWPWVVAVAAVAALAAGLYTLLPDKPSAPSRAVKVKSLTSFAGYESSPTWSPDGSFIAYGHTASGPMNIYVVSTAGGEPIRLTDNPVDDETPRWSPDGRHIAFVSYRDGELHVYLVPPLGGVERRLVNTNFRYTWAWLVLGAEPWSPDGRALAFSRLGSAGEIALWKVDLETRREVQITNHPPNCYDTNGSWSPDGEQIVFVRSGTEEDGLWLVPAAGGEPHLLLGDEFYNDQPAWSSDGKSIVFTSSRSGTNNLWEIDVASGEMRQVTTGPGWDESPVVARDGRIAYDQFSHQTDLYLMSVEGGAERRLTFHTHDNFAARISPDGRKIIYHSDRAGSWDIWLLEVESGTETRLTDHPGMDMYPEWSPDGQEIVFASDRGGAFQFWVLNVEGGGLRLLSDRTVTRRLFEGGVDSSWGPRWSRDGKTIGYIDESEEGRSLWLLDVESGEAGPRLNGVVGFDWYLDSYHLIYSRVADDVSRPLEMRALDLETGEETVLLEGDHSELIVAPNGSAVAYCSAASHFNMNLYFLPLTPPSSAGDLPRPAGEPRQLTRGEGLWHVHNGGWSPDAKEVVYTRDADSGDIYVIEGYK